MNFYIYFLSLLQKYQYTHKNNQDSYSFEKNIDFDAFGNKVNFNIEIFIDENKKIKQIQYPNFFIEQFQRDKNYSKKSKEEIQEVINTIIIEDLRHQISISDDKIIWRIENKVDFEKHNKDKIKLKDIFRDKDSLAKYNIEKNDDYLRNKHICSTPYCNNTIDLRNSHYIPAFVLRNMLNKKNDSILKAYPFSFNIDDIDFKRNHLSDFILSTTAGPSIYNTARIYCGECENSLFDYENNELFFTDEDKYQSIIKSLSQRFMDFISVKGKELDILKKSIKLNNNANKIKKNHIKKIQLLNKIKKRFPDKQNLSNNHEIQVFFEIDSFIPLSSMAVILGNNISKIFRIKNDASLMNGCFEKSILFIHICPKKSTYTISFDFKNLTYMDLNIVRTFFTKNFNLNNIKEVALASLNATFSNFSEIFIAEDYFLNLYHNHQYLLLNAIAMRDTNFSEESIFLGADNLPNNDNDMNNHFMQLYKQDIINMNCFNTLLTDINLLSKKIFTCDSSNYVDHKYKEFSSYIYENYDVSFRIDINSDKDERTYSIILDNKLVFTIVRKSVVIENNYVLKTIHDKLDSSIVHYLKDNIDGLNNSLIKTFFYMIIRQEPRTIQFEKENLRNNK